MNKNIFDYDISTDPVALWQWKIYRFAWRILLPAVLIMLIILALLLLFGSTTGLEQAEENSLRVEKNIKSAQEYFKY